MPKPLKISVVIPVYNERAYIVDCLASVLSQSLAPYEVIVVDNGSTDNTVNIVKQFPQVKILPEPKRGRLYAMQTGFLAAKGEWIVRIDADTRLTANWLESLAWLITHRPADAYTGGGCFYDTHFPRLLGAMQRIGYQYVQYPAAGGYTLWGSCMAISQQAWRSVAAKLPRHQGLDEDIVLSLSLRRQRKKICFSPLLNVRASLLRGQLGIRRSVSYLWTWPYDYIWSGSYVGAIYIFFITLILSFLVVPLQMLRVGFFQTNLYVAQEPEIS